MVLFYCLNTRQYNRNLTVDEENYTDSIVKRTIDYSRYDQSEVDYDTDEESSRYPIKDEMGFYNCKYYEQAKKYTYKKQFVVSLIGRTETGEKIVFHVIDYQPHFYVQIPNEFKGYEKKFVNWLFAQMQSRIKNKYHFAFGKPYVEKDNRSIIGHGDPIMVLRINFTNSSAAMKAEMLFMTEKIMDKNDGSHKHGFDLGGKLFMYDKSPTVFNHGFIRKNNFFIENDIKPVGWMEINDFVSASNVTVAKYEYSTKCAHIKMRPDVTTSPIYVGIAFDIETSPAFTGSANPQPLDPIITLCVSVIKTDFVHPSERKSYALCLLMEPEKNDLFEHIVCANDYEILLAFRDIVIHEQPDYITTYNGFVFDWARVQSKWPDSCRYLERWSIFPDYICKRIVEKKILIKQPVEWKYYNIPGVINIDLYVYIQFSDDNDLKFLPDNKLKTIAMHYLNDTKDDLEYKKMYQMFNIPYHKYKGKYDTIDEATKKDIFIISKYCLKDASLLHDLISKRMILQFWYMVSYVCNTTINDVVGGSKGRRILNKIVEVIHKKGWKLLIPMKKYLTDLDIFNELIEKNATDLEKYKSIVDKQKQRIFREQYLINHRIMGGLVGQCDVGVLDLVAVLDVNSEYPNVIISNNLSPENIITETDPFCHTCTTDDTTSPEIKCACGKYIRSKYIIPTKWELNDGTIYESYIYDNGTLGVLPTMLSELLVQRANVRKVGKTILGKITAIKKYMQYHEKYSDCTLTDYVKYLAGLRVTGTTFHEIPDTVALRMKLTDENPNKNIDNLIAIDKYVETNEEYIAKSKLAKEYQIENEKYIENETIQKEHDYLSSISLCDLNQLMFDLKVDYSRTETEQLAIKVINNSAYGVLGQPQYILHRKDLAGMVTYHARSFNINCMKLLEHYLPGSVKVYGDTDSIFFTINDPTVFDGLDKLDAFKKMYNYATIATKIINIDARNRGKKTMTIEFEKIFPRIIFTGKKKRYYGLKIIGENGVIPNPKNAKKMIMGFDFKKKSAAKIEKEMCDHILNLIINDQVDQIPLYFKEMITDIYAGKYNVDYFVYRKRYKGNDAYKNKQIIQCILHNRLVLLLGDKAPSAGEDISFLFKRKITRIKNTGIYAELTKRDIAIAKEEYDPSTDLIDYKIYIKQIFRYHSDIFNWLIEQKKLSPNIWTDIEDEICKHDPFHNEEITKYN